MRFALLSTLLMLGLPAHAADWALQSGDQVFDVAAMADRLRDREIGFHDGGKSVYGPGAQYAYVYSDGRPVPGVYRIADDASVCVDFDNGWSRCDLYVTNGGRLILITEDGDRFPVKLP